VRELHQPRIVGLHLRVHGVEGQVEEERLALVPLDETDGFAAEGVGEVLLFIGLLRPAEDAFVSEIVVPATEEAKKLVEAALLRVLLRLRTEMPICRRGPSRSRRPSADWQSSFRSTANPARRRQD